MEQEEVKAMSENLDITYGPKSYRIIYEFDENGTCTWSTFLTERTVTVRLKQEENNN